MNFTDIFIRRPVLATVVSLMILVIGLKAFSTLPILQYPRTENAVVTVSTTYYGADPDIVAGFITTPLENAIAQANGIDYMSSTSRSGISTISVFLRLNYDSDKAVTEIQTKITSVRNQLPPQAQEPVISIQIGQTIDSMYIGFKSDVLPQNYITDYLLRVVQPKMQAIEGVQTAEIIGGQNFALRAWLNPQKLASYGLTAGDISNALSKNNYISGLGNTKGQMVQFNLNASTDLHNLEEFRNLVVQENGDTIIRLKDVANVTLGSDTYESSVGFDGKKAVYIGLQVAPSANLLEVMKSARDLMPEIQSQLPQGLVGEIIYDSTDFVASAIDEVKSTLIESVLIVALVVFLFLGSARSVLIPVIAIPLSLIGALIFMLALGFSINLLTLLALVLGIGLVVDDAIIVVENVNRHIDEGMSPLDASLKAARELAGPIIAMTIVLVAVYVPIGFQGGLTGALFTEFAFTLVGAITISAIVALTLSPMMCSRFFQPKSGGLGWQERFVKFIDHRFDKLRSGYERRLRGSLSFIPVTLVFAAIILGSIYFLYSFSKTELAPQEDQGIIITLHSTAPNATLEQRELYGEKAVSIIQSYPETGHIFQINTSGQFISGMRLKPWSERERTANDIQPILQKDLGGIAGIRTAAFQPPPLPGSRGLPIQFVITGTKGFDQLFTIAKTFMQEAQSSGRFIFLDTDLKIDLPQSTVQINREKAAQFGLTMNDIGGSLSSMLGGGYVNYFNLSGRSYKVIPQVEQKSRLTTAQLGDYYIKNSEGVPIPLSTIASIETKTIPQSLNHFQQLNSATISGVAFPGVAVGDALAYLRDLAKRTLPEGYGIDYAGQSRQFAQESSGFVMTFVFALIIIFLTLAAQFESFRDPLIILISVPMSIAGALVFICLGLGGASINIYTQVGLVTLMGLISKHGILITEFANKLQEEGKTKQDSIIEASAIRLRPILMTTAAMVLGVVPLILATGAGALSRRHMGIVIASGLTIGTLFTLFVVPAVYMVLAEDHHVKKSKTAELS